MDHALQATLINCEEAIGAFFVLDAAWDQALCPHPLILTGNRQQCGYPSKSLRMSLLRLSAHCLIYNAKMAIDALDHQNLLAIFFVNFCNCYRTF